MTKKILLTFSLLLTFSCIFSQTEKYKAQFNAIPLENVIQELEEKYGLLFSYRVEDVQGTIFSGNISENNLTEFLENIFQPHDFLIEIIDGNYVVLKKINPPENISQENDENEISFCGTVIDELTKQPLHLANVYLKKSKHGSTSAENGQFQFSAPTEKNDTIFVSHIGYEIARIPVPEFENQPCQTIQLELYNFWEDLVVITDYLTDGVDLVDNGGTTVLSPGKIGALPGQAEPDMFSTIKFLPGISSSTGEASNLNVRGGASDQNLILWEGIPIYHSAHYFGMISAFNPYIIDEIKIYRGGFGAEYGGRVSGVVDMSSKGTKNSDSKYGAGINFLNAYAHGTTTFWKNKASLIFSLRHSINDFWRSPTFKNITRRNQQSQLFQELDVYNLPRHISTAEEFNFFDSHLKGNILVSENDELDIAFFYGKNNFEDSIFDKKKRREQTDTLNLENNGISISWRHNWSKSFSSRLSGVSTFLENNYDFLIEELDGDEGDFFGRKNNSVQEKQFNFSNEYASQNNCRFTLGYQYFNYDLDYRISNETNSSSLVDEQRVYENQVHAIYAGIKTDLNRPFGVDAGIRWSHFDFTGKNYLQPRLRLWHNLENGLTFSSNVGIYNQYLSQLVDLRGNQDGIETPIWVVTGGKDVPVLSAEQYQIGATYRKNKWVIDMQAYTKQTKGLTSRAFDFDTNRGFELGESSARGLDLLLKKTWKKYRSWVSYSLSKVDYKFDRLFDRNFPAPYDQRHSLNWVNMYEYGNFEFSLGLEIYSGNPYSKIVDFKIEQNDLGNDVVQAIYNELNDFNLPLQHRMDASVLYNFEAKDSEKLNGVIGLSFFNIYNQKNIYARDYFVRSRPNTPRSIQFVDKANLGFTPNAVVRIEW